MGEQVVPEGRTTKGEGIEGLYKLLVELLREGEEQVGEAPADVPGEELLLEYTEGETSRVEYRQGEEASNGDGTWGMRDGDSLGDPPGVVREQHDEDGDRKFEGELALTGGWGIVWNADRCGEQNAQRQMFDVTPLRV